MKFKVKFKKEKFPHGYVGMNKYAANSRKLKSKGIKFSEGSKTIVLWKGLGKRARRHTLNHEKIEAHLMKNKKYSYDKAHNIALKHERDKNIKNLITARRFNNGK